MLNYVKGYFTELVVPEMFFFGYKFVILCTHDHATFL
jgi:hypothetical protein